MSFGYASRETTTLIQTSYSDSSTKDRFGDPQLAICAIDACRPEMRLPLKAGSQVQQLLHGPLVAHVTLRQHCKGEKLIVHKKKCQLAKKTQVPDPFLIVSTTFDASKKKIELNNDGEAGLGQSSACFKHLHLLHRRRYLGTAVRLPEIRTLRGRRRHDRRQLLERQGHARLLGVQAQHRQQEKIAQRSGR